MPTETIELAVVLAAPPERIYQAWLDPEEHTAMTGGEATADGRGVGATFTAWDGYISGKNLELEAGRRIVQSWRTSEFPDDSPDSRLELGLSAVSGGTELTLRHTAIPAGQSARYAGGWRDYYFAPMARYFAGGAGLRAPANPRPAPSRRLRRATTRIPVERTPTPVTRPTPRKRR